MMEYRQERNTVDRKKMEVINGTQEEIMKSQKLTFEKGGYSAPISWNTSY